MPCYFDPVSSTTASGPYYTNSSTPSQIFPALPLPDCQHPTNCQQNCHKPTSPPTNSPPCNPATAFIIPQYRMTCFSRASWGCVRTGRLWYFANYPTVPQCRQWRGITMSQCYQSQLFFHVTVSTVSSFHSIFALFHHKAGLPTVPRNTAPRNTAPTRKRFRHWFHGTVK